MIELPTNGIRAAEPRFIDRGGVLKALSGGADQRVDRMGSRWGASFTTKPMKAAEAALWISRLTRGKREKAAIKFPQPGFPIPQATDYTVNGNQLSNAFTLSIISASAGEVGKTFKEGQFIAVIQAGKRYVHQVAADAVVSAGRIADLSIYPALRIAPATGNVVEVLAPKIEGYVSGEDQLGWSIDEAKIYGLQFDIEEAG